MDTSPWPQEIVVKAMDEIVVTNTINTSSVLERKVRPLSSQKDHQQALNCPRCHSTNTKFCYYNNYSLSQPRYICKTCRRYWTQGGSLRNIPVGGGSRKNKRSSNNSSSYANIICTSSSSKKILSGPTITHQNPSSKIHENSTQDLNLGFATSYTDDDDDHGHSLKSLTEMIQVPSFENNKNILKNSYSPNMSALELLTGSRGLESSSGFIPLTMIGDNTNTDHLHRHNPDTVYSIPLSAEFVKPSLDFSLDGLGNNYGSFQGNNTNGKQLLFPFEENSKTHHVSSNDANDADQQENRAQYGDDSNGFWNNGVIRRESW